MPWDSPLADNLTFYEISCQSATIDSRVLRLKRKLRQFEDIELRFMLEDTGGRIRSLPRKQKWHTHRCVPFLFSRNLLPNGATQALVALLFFIHNGGTH
jgi:hypothetical protein